MSDAGPAVKEKKPRLLYIDNLRILLISLVISTHCAITYGGPGMWYFSDPGNAQGVPLVLAVLGSLNQSFFMGFFTMVSAYFVPGSLMRKGRTKFAHDRLIRLGIPLLFWIIVLNPIILLILTLSGATLSLPVATFLNPVTGGGMGPMWFVWFLLLATGAYMIWTAYRPPAPAGSMEKKPFPGFAAIAGFGLLLGAVTAVVRIFLPIGSTWLFGFQLSFFPQYIALFIIGIYAAQNRWLDAIPERVGKACTLIALALAAIQPIFISAVLNSPAAIDQIAGGLQWQAVLYAMWEQMFCVMVITALTWIFSRWLNTQGPVTSAMGGDSYTVYVFHPVVLISLSIAFVGVALPQLAKFAIVLPLAIAISFILARLIRSIPGVDRVL